MAGQGPPDGWAYTAPGRRERYWLHTLLFFLTLITTTIVGAGFQYDFARNIPFDVEQSLNLLRRMWMHPAYLVNGLPFSGKVRPDIHVQPAAECHGKPGIVGNHTYVVFAGRDRGDAGHG